MFDYYNVPLEMKETDSNGTIEGYAAVYNNVDSGFDVIRRGAFAESLQDLKATGRTVKMLRQHDPAKVIGVWDEFHEDERGLKCKGRILTDVALGKETLALLRAKALSGLSIGYKTLQSDRITVGDMIAREITKAELWETSVVTFPMNELAGVTDVKNLSSPRDVERILRDAGVPNKFAKLVATKGYQGAMEALNPDHRDGDEPEALNQGSLSALLDELREIKEAING